MFRHPLIAALALSLFACAPVTMPDDTMASDMVTITGELAYRERIALTPGHVMEVKLLDVSRMDAPSVTLAEMRRTLTDEQVPLPFTLKVEAAKLDVPMTSVRGTISAPDGSLAWTTDTASPVNASETVQDLGTLQLVRVSGAASQSSDLRGTQYVCGGESIMIIPTVDGVRLNVSTESYTMMRMPAASGAKYQTGEMIFWEKGEEAMLQWNTTDVLSCQRV